MADRHRFAQCTLVRMDHILDVLLVHPRGLSKRELLDKVDVTRDQMDRALRLMAKAGVIEFNKLLDQGTCQRGRWRMKDA